MKRKLKGVLGVGLTLVMVLSLMVAFAPVAAAADYTENDWGTWGMPAIDTETDIGPMAVAPDGTLFKSVWDWDLDELRIEKSDDNGYTWDATELDDLDPNAFRDRVVGIAIGKNYEDDEILYVATLGGTVYRLEEAGDGDVTAIKAYPGDEVTALYSIDTWYDGDYNWIMVGTNADVFVLRDKVFEDWRPQELGNNAYEVAFAPDFDDSELIWVITDDGEFTDYFVISSTVSPGDWGLEIANATLSGVTAGPWVDLDFPDNYDSDPKSGDTILFAAISSNTFKGGDVYLIEGVKATDPPSNAIALMDLAGEAFAGEDIVSLAVSGDYPDCVILAGNLNEPSIYISDDGGDGWSTADKQPTGEWWTHVYMDADVVWDGDVFDVEESMSFVSTFGYESAVSRSDPNEDGDLVYNQVGEIDTLIYGILDLGFHPDFPDTPSLLMITAGGGGPFLTISLWLSENGDEEEPDYMRVLCASPSGAPGNHVGGLRLVDWSWDGDVIYIHGDYGAVSVIWKSTDDGQTFGKRRVVKGDVAINDWEIPLDNTIYAATDGKGFLLTTNSGLSWTETDVGGNMNDIAMSPDFEDGEGFIALGGMGGNVYLSDDDGDTFDDSDDSATDLLTGDVFVAFDADFADDDADGYMFIYAAGQGDAIQQGEVSDTDDVDWDPLEDDQDEATQDIFCTGLQVAEDNALYALGLLEEVEEDEIVGVDGFLRIQGDDSHDMAPVVVDEVSDVKVLSGTFDDSEDVTITADADLMVSVDVGPPYVVTVSGRIWITGDATGAVGRFALDGATVAIVSPTFQHGEAFTIIGDQLEIDITREVSGGAAVARLLLNESNSEWESADDTDLDNPMGLWLSLGSNVLWAIDADDAELWVLEDTCSGQVTLDSPSNGYKSDYEDQMRVAWDELRDADEYEVKYYHLDTGDSDVDDGIEDTDVLLKELSASSEYEWKVRVSVGEPWHSRWSDKWSFHTALGAPPWAPTLYTPGGIWQYSGIAVELMPAFSWESAKSADGYQFVLADNAEFTSPLVNEKTPESAYQLDFELEYNSNYFWKVMAYKGNDAISRWSDIGAFTTIEKAVPALTPAPPVTVTPAAPAPIILPTPIPPVLLWVIVGIGAALIVAVIILIVRTRRVV